MARLTKNEWQAGRLRWEREINLSFAQLGEELGVSRKAVSQMAAREEWARAYIEHVPQAVNVPLEVPAHVPLKVPPHVPAKPPRPSKKEEVTISHPEAHKPPRPVGRPSSYQETYPALMLEYFKENKAYSRIPLNNGAIHYSPNELPTFTKFAERIGVSEETLRNWAKARNKEGLPIRPEFFGAYARARKIQEDFILECGLVGAFNSSIVTLLLKNCHGYEDMKREEIDVTANKRSVEEVEAAIIEGMRKTKELQKTVEGRFYRITGLGSPPINTEIND